MTTPELQLPPYPESAWGSFPPDHLVPEAVRPLAEKLGELKTKALDARDAAVEAHAAIDKAEAGAILKAADALAAGDNAAVDPKPVEKAKAAYEQARRNAQATFDALPRVDAEVYAAYVRNQDEAKRLVDDQIAQTKADYAIALDALMQARKAHADALSHKRFTRNALMPISTAGRRGGRGSAPYRQLAIDPRDYAQFSAEIEPPKRVLSRPVDPAIPDGPMERVDEIDPADAW